MSEIVIWGLLAMNVFQIVFWSFQLHRLVDKVMSGNYYAYEQAKHISDQLPAKVGDVFVPEDLRGVTSLNPFA
jgi:hypothetical protein